MLSPGVPLSGRIIIWVFIPAWPGMAVDARESLGSEAPHRSERGREALTALAQFRQPALEYAECPLVVFQRTGAGSPGPCMPSFSAMMSRAACGVWANELSLLEVEGLGYEAPDSGRQQAAGEGLRVLDQQQGRQGDAGLDPRVPGGSSQWPSAGPGWMGNQGSKVILTSSSSVVTVMLTWTRPRFRSISRNRSASRRARGLRVWTTSLGLCLPGQDLQYAPGQLALAVAGVGSAASLRTGARSPDVPRPVPAACSRVHGMLAGSVPRTGAGSPGPCSRASRP